MGEVQGINKRVPLIDELRGFAIICMVLYHGAYDLVVLYGYSIPIFETDFMDALSTAFAMLFVVISGTACRYSRNNYKRGVICFTMGMIITMITYFATPDDFIRFGILHMLGISMIVFSLTHRIFDKISPIWGIALMIFLSVITYNIPSRYIGITGLIEIGLPGALYKSGYLFPFGFINYGFISSDYFPLFPWLFIFLAGSYFGVYFKGNKLPKGFYKGRSRPLAFVGRHTMIIYLAHQPIILGLIMAMRHISGA
ncbi:MAG: DUF1624 domain-containing protein [Clostridiales bacterium]|nr:DUF1624 domain-containing protein [Clostridiales bacterium]